MAEVETDIRTLLMTKAGVTSIFGASPNTRIHTDHKEFSLVEDNYPYAIIRTVTEAPDYVHDGALPVTGLYQIDIYSDVLSTAKSGFAAIKTEMSALTGTMGTSTVGHSFVTDIRGGFDPDVKIFRRSVDVEIGLNG